MDAELIRQRKRKAASCPSLSELGEWLQNKRVCLRGQFCQYRRESVVDALRAAGALVSIHPSPQRSDMLVLGEETRGVQPPYLRESQLHQPILWYLRFEVVQPWYQHFAPQSSRELVGRERETAGVRVWLQEWERGKGKPALLLSGPVGCGKHSLLRCVLAEQGYTQLLDLCAVADGMGQQSLPQLCADLQGHSYNSLGLRGCAQGKVVLLCHSMEKLKHLRKAEKQKQKRKKKENYLCNNEEEEEKGKTKKVAVQHVLQSLLSILQRRLLPVVFVVQEGNLKKRDAFWQKIGSLYCEQLTLSPLSPSRITLILQQLSANMPRPLSARVLQSLASHCHGDVRAALVELEWMMRFESSAQSKDAISAQPHTLLSFITQPNSHTFDQRLRLLHLQGVGTAQCLLQALHHYLDSCKSGAAHLEAMSHALSDAALFLPGNDYNYDLLLPGCAAGWHMKPITPSYFPWKNERTAKDGAKLLTQESDLRLSPSSSLRYASASTFNLELLSAYPSLLKKGKDRPALEKQLILQRFQLTQ